MNQRATHPLRANAIFCTALAMLAFAGNSILCRLALKHSAIDPASFTSVRIASGALTLWLIVRWRAGPEAPAGNWPSALALFGYAAAFSFAYTQLTAGTGALLLFGAVQATMIGYGIARGERLRGWRLLGFVLALLGLGALLLPGLTAPPPSAAALMLGAGVAWAVYSLRGKGAGDPLRATAGNFARAVVPTLALSALTFAQASADAAGFVYALLSGVLASGIGYAIWYTALPLLNVASAATAQLSVPVLTAAAAVLLLDEPLTLRTVLCSALTLGGIALVLLVRSRDDTA